MPWKPARLWPRVLVGFVVLGAVLGGSVFLVLPRVAREYAVSQARARGVVLSVARARLGWLTVSLDDAHLELENVRGVEVGFASILVQLDTHLHPVRLAGARGHVTVAVRESLGAELDAWRAARPSAAPVAARQPVAVDVEIDDAIATFDDGRQVTATHVRARRQADTADVSFAAVEAAMPPLTVKASDGRLAFEGAVNTLREAHVASADVVWAAARSVEPRSDVTPADQAPSVPAPPEPDAALRGKRKPRRSKEPEAPLPRLLPGLHELRAAVDALIAAVAARVPAGSGIQVDALSARLVKGGEQLTLGSGALSVERDSRRINVSFSTSPLARATPLSLRADLPTGPGDIELSVSGGPVPLGLLGVHDGGLLHLLDVERTSLAGKGRVVLDAPAHSLTFDIEGSVRDLSTQDSRLARDPVRGMDLGFSTRGVIDDKGELRLDEAEASVGAAHAAMHGGLRQSADRVSAAFDFDFPTSSCQALLRSVPSALVPTVGAARMDGTFSLRGRLAFDTQDIDALVFDFDVNDRCRLVDVPPELEKGRFAHDFTHVIYSKTGEREEETTGPGTPNWTSLDDISPYMQVAVLTTEDGAFFHHHGFNHAAIRNAVAADIRARRFARGASTITMQLAKNLFLTREKTVARKLEELVLADYLEQAFTKDEIMELYLNVIEFGPDVYGVTAAAQHYFGRRPNELNLAEALFLSSILPNPIAFHKVYEDGHVGDAWLRTIRARMEVAARNGLISPPELAEGITEDVVFHKENSPPPVPRPPVSTPSHPASSADWEELN